ncbi:MAG: AraC family transcriptional regulator [Bacilli bacterium]
MREDFKSKLMILTEEEMMLLKFQENNTINAINPNEVIKGNDLYIDNDIKIRKLSRFTYFNEHYHEYIELSYGVNGVVKHIINDEKVYLKEDNFILISSKAKHRTEETDIGDMAVNFTISSNYILKLINNISDDDIRKKLKYYCFNNSDFILITRPNEDMVILFESLIYYLTHKKYSYVDIKQFIDFVISNFLVSSYRSSVINHITDEHDIQHKLITYIKSNFTIANLNDFSTICGYSYYECSKLVKKIMNKNFKDVVRVYRLEIAAKLLNDSNYSITHISRYVGYENTSYFYKIFINEFGVTPKEFRENKNKSSNNVEM